MHEETFTLTNEEPQPRPRKFESDRGQQRVLFSGLDCLPGQLDLFATDGELTDEVD